MPTHALAAALDAGDRVRARELVRGVQPSALDDVLEVLARHAASDNEATAAAAVELLVEELERSGTLRRFAGASLVDEAAVDDVVQESLIAVARAAPGFRGSAKVTTWVHRIVRNCVVDHLRAQRAMAPLPEELRATGTRMSSVIATRETVQQVIASLPEHYREAV
ncbi:RNA polymerase sigma factor, partial [Pseudactinotalea sp.]|uniref:RNA polymerase sigma factor n=1 Tax=Pseudactinotalea sp. TaxID=1926260 RepID=UPI003B3B977E